MPQHLQSDARRLHMTSVCQRSERRESGCIVAGFVLVLRSCEALLLFGGGIGLGHCSQWQQCGQHRDGERGRTSSYWANDPVAQRDASEAAKTDIAWGHQIRSYVLQPYQLVKDVRTGEESTNPAAVLDGDIDSFLETSLAHRMTGADAIKVEDLD